MENDASSKNNDPADAYNLVYLFKKVIVSVFKWRLEGISSKPIKFASINEFIQIDPI